MPGVVTRFGVDDDRNIVAISDGVEVGEVPSKTATTPATWGVAIEVPEMVLVAVVLLIHAEVMLEPGAKMSRHVPKLE